MKSVAYSDDRTNNYHLTLEIPSALWRFFSSLFCFFWPATFFRCFGSLSPLSWYCFMAAAGSCLHRKKALMSPLYTSCPALNCKQTKLASNWWTCGAFTRKRARYFPQGLVENKNRAKRRVNIGLTFTWWPKTQLQLIAGVALYLLNVWIGNCLLTSSPFQPKKGWYVDVVFTACFYCLQEAKKIFYCRFKKFQTTVVSMRMSYLPIVCFGWMTIWKNYILVKVL